MLSAATESVVLASGDGLAAAYYHNKDFTGFAFNRVDPTVDFSWGQGSPHTSIHPDTFSVRWTGFLEAPATGTYTISTVTDDGVRLWVNNKLLIDKWSGQRGATNSATISLQAGQRYDLRMDYYESTGTATARLLWSVNGSAATAIPKQYLYTTKPVLPQLPAAPSGLTAEVVQGTGVLLKWTDNASNEGGFVIERQVAGGAWTQIGMVAANVTQLTDSAVSPGTQYGYRVSAVNAAGSSAWSAVATATTNDAINTWYNSGFASQAGRFEARFDAKPAAANMDVVIGLSNGAASKWTDLATIVRFNNANQIDARNGGAYSATNAVSYVPGATYQFRMVVDVAAKRYDVYVTPQGGSETLLAQNFAFRTEQASVASLSNRAKFSTAGDVTVSNFSIGATITAPAAPTGMTAHAVSTSQINLSWIDNANNETGYVVERMPATGGAWTTIATLGVNATSYSDSGLAADTQYAYRVAAVNEAGASAWVQTSVKTLAPAPAPDPIQTDALNVWYNTSLASQNGAFELRFNAVPRAAKADAVIGLSNSAAKAYSDLAAAVRFSNVDRIDAYNGSGYTAATAVTYTPGTTYQFRMVVDVVNKRYDVYVTPQGGAEVLLGKGFAFRSTQASVASLGNMAKFATVGDATISGTALTTLATPAPDPTPTPPPPTSNPTPPPPTSTARPGPNNTGPTNKSILKTVGSMTIRQDGAVIENVHVKGTVNIYASNVVMRNFIVDAGGSAGSAIKVHPGSKNVLIEDGEVTNSVAALITGTGFTARRLNIHHGGQDGFNPYDNVVIENNWVHHLGMQTGSHADGVQLGGGSNFVIRNNYFDMPINQSGYRSNAAIFIRAWKSPIRNVTVDGNWLNGGNYTVYVMDDSSDVRVTNNWFGRDFRYGPKRVNATGTVTWSNNRFWDNSALIP